MYQKGPSDLGALVESNWVGQNFHLIGVQWKVLMNISALNDQIYILRDIIQICVPPWHSWNHVTSIVERTNL